MMIRTALIKSLQDIWEEMLYLALFNLFCVLSMIFLPFTLFALFATAYDIGKGKAIKIHHFFEHLKATWQHAAVWGIINIAVYAIIGANLLFYEQFGTAQWAVFLRLSVTGLAMFWALIQLLVLAIYPRLVEPGYKIALQNSAALIGLSPLSILLLAIVSAMILMFTIIFTPLLFFVPFAVIAVFANRIVEGVVSQHLADSKTDS